MAPLAVTASVGGSGSPPPVIVDSNQTKYEGYWISELYATTFVETTVNVPTISCNGNNKGVEIVN